jgi:hypothetical protein
MLPEGKVREGGAPSPAREAHALPSMGASLRPN